jgi:hypothetical protein
VLHFTTKEAVRFLAQDEEALWQSKCDGPAKPGVASRVLRGLASHLDRNDSAPIPWLCRSAEEFHVRAYVW